MSATTKASRLIGAHAHVAGGLARKTPVRETSIRALNRAAGDALRKRGIETACHHEIFRQSCRPKNP